MAQLTPGQQETVDKLTALGIEPELAQRAAAKFDGNLEQAANWVFDGAQEDAGNDDNAMPPLIPSAPNNSPPLQPVQPQAAYAKPWTAAQTASGGVSSQEKQLPPPPPYSVDATDFRPDDKPSSGDAKPEKTEIDLTGEDSDSQQTVPSNRLLLPAPYPSSNTAGNTGEGGAAPVYCPQPAGADDLQRALQASQLDADDKDDELSKAISMSMATLGSTEDEAIGLMEAIQPEDRVREGNSPVVLRSTSNFMSGLAAYFECLYAVPSFRRAILAYTPPPRAQLDFADYRDYWKGDSAISNVGLPLPVGGEKENRENRLIALQRLFVLMQETRRAFLHISEVTRAFGLRESDFQQAGGAWVYKINEIHAVVVEDLRIAAGEMTQALLAQGVSTSEAEKFEREATARFALKGRVVPVDEHIAAPLPPVESEEPAAVLSLSVNPVATPPQDLFACLDAKLIDQTNDIPPKLRLHLLTAIPSTLFFHIERETFVTSLDDFGSGPSNLASRRSVFRPTRKRDPSVPTEEELLWLDRYWVKNRVKIAEGRAEMDRLEGLLDEAKKRRREVAVTADGKDARQVVRGTVEYLEKTAASGDASREERQRRLREQWGRVAEELDSVVKHYDQEIDELDRRLESIFSSPDMQRIGPYRLSAILMHDGLYGRDTAWSVVRDDDGRWWRMLDTTKVETTLDEALSDSRGVKMNAGAVFLLYQKVEEESGIEVQVPAHLKRAALIDNHDFASSLPASYSALVDSWQLPPVAALRQDEAIQIPLVPAQGDDDTETVKDISLDGEDSPPPEDIMIDQGAAAAAESRTGTATPMSVDGASDVEAAADRDPMRLRGGAGTTDTAEDVDEVELDEEDEEDEEDGSDYDDEIDEDEVELGLLQPMPVNRDDWDIDYAIGKVGGLPRWLDPRSPLGPEDVQCGACNRTMSLLMQVNSPDDSRPHAAARSLYVFACRTSGCLAKEPQQALRVWRTQMESPNAFYPHTEATQAERKRLENALDSTSALSRAPSTSARPWPEYDIAAEPEPYEESYLPAPAPEQAEPGNEDVDAPDTRTGVDSAFLIFQERIEREPRQVLRFYRIPGIDDPQPLWASHRKITPEQVPTCELCRGERKVEFQILSTILPSLEDETFDFDSLLVYTCANNCAIPPREGGKTGWQAELAFKQDFAAAGVKFGFQ
ncbi:hypothetical protein JCM8202v2_005685 [Rhodotorula sphaerocarpa]